MMVLTDMVSLTGVYVILASTPYLIFVCICSSKFPNLALV